MIEKLYSDYCLFEDLANKLSSQPDIADKLHRQMARCFEQACATPVQGERQYSIMKKLYRKVYGVRPKLVHH